MEPKTERVAAYLKSSVPTAPPSETAAQALQGLSGRRFSSVDSVYVVDEDGRLLGAAKLSELYAAPPGAMLADVMRTKPPSVAPETDREVAASLAIRQGLAALPVVGSDRQFLGVFPPRAIMQVLREEHLEDLHRMAGILRHSEQARDALQAPTLRRVRNRMPWLVLGLLGSMLAASLVSQFEETLRAQIALAFFIPAIVYLADAVGTQTEAVAVRGLSLTDEGIVRLLLGELYAGILLGLGIAVPAGLFALSVFGDMGLAAVVGISLICACTVATTIGLFLPWAFAEAGWDPALASGPVATIVQDVLSLLIYFSAASIIL